MANDACWPSAQVKSQQDGAKRFVRYEILHRRKTAWYEDTNVIGRPFPEDRGERFRVLELGNSFKELYGLCTHGTIAAKEHFVVGHRVKRDRIAFGVGEDWRVAGIHDLVQGNFQFIEIVARMICLIIAEFELLGTGENNKNFAMAAA